MRDLELLAQRHFELCHAESPVHRATLIIWYADVGVDVNGEVVWYHCPQCGKRYSSSLGEFVHHETREGLLCSTCLKEPEERVGPFD